MSFKRKCWLEGNLIRPVVFLSSPRPCCTCAVMFASHEKGCDDWYVNTTACAFHHCHWRTSAITTWMLLDPLELALLVLFHSGQQLRQSSVIPSTPSKMRNSSSRPLSLRCNTCSAVTYALDIRSVSSKTPQLVGAPLMCGKSVESRVQHKKSGRRCSVLNSCQVLGITSSWFTSRWHAFGSFLPELLPHVCTLLYPSGVLPSEAVKLDTCLGRVT